MKKEIDICIQHREKASYVYDKERHIIQGESDTTQGERRKRHREEERTEKYARTFHSFPKERENVQFFLPNPEDRYNTGRKKEATQGGRKI